MAKFKKLLGMLFASVMVLSICAFAACGGKTPDDPNPGPKPLPENVIEKIEVTRYPDKMEYYTGETFDPTGMEVTAVYSDYSTEVVTDYEIDPSGPLERTPNQEITVIYKNKMTHFDGVLVEDPEITGTVYRFEAEEAQILKGNTAFNCSYIRPAAGTSQGYVLDVRNNDKGGDHIKGGTDPDNPATHVGPKWVVHSDKATTVRFRIRSSLRTKTDTKYVGAYNPDNNWRAYKKNLSEMWGIFINGEKFEENTVMTAYGTGSNSIQIYSQYQFRTVEFNIDLKKGDNEIWFNVSSKGKDAGAIDYMELVSADAVLTDKTHPTKHAVSDDASEQWEIVQNPSRYDVGWIGKLCAVCNKVVAMEKIPALIETDKYESVTATKEATQTEDGLGTYTFSFDGQTFELKNTVIPAKGKHNVYRLEGEDGHVTGKTEDGKNVNCADNVISTGADVGTGGTKLGRDVSEASGQIYLGNMGVAGNRIAYTLSADKAVTANFALRVAKPVISEKAEIAINKVWLVKVNGVNAFADDVMIAAGSANNSKTAPAYCDWVTLEVNVPLKSGDNEIVCEMQHNEDEEDETVGFKSNFDCIEIDSTAILTDKTEKTVAHVRGWTLTKVPGHIDNPETNEITGSAHDANCVNCGMTLKTKNVKTIEIPVISKQNSDYRQVTMPDGSVWGEYTYRPVQGGAIVINYLEKEAPTEPEQPSPEPEP